MHPPGTRPPQLLVASNNHGPGVELSQLAERQGYTVRRAHTGAQLLEQAHAVPPDLVALDEALTDMDTLAASRALRADPRPRNTMRRYAPACGSSCATRSRPKRSPPSSTPTCC